MWYLGIFFFCLSRVAREKDSKGGGERNSPCSCPKILIFQSLIFFVCGGENWQGIKAYKAMRFLTQSRRNEISIHSLLLDKTRLSLHIIGSFKLLLKVAVFFFTCYSSHVFTKVCLIIECNTVPSCISLYIWFHKLSSLIFVHWPNKGPRKLTIVLPAPFIRLHPFLFNYLVSLYKISWPNKDSFISVVYVLPLVYLFVLMLIPTSLVYCTYRI